MNPLYNFFVVINKFCIKNVGIVGNQSFQINNDIGGRGEIIVLVGKAFKSTKT